MLFAAHVLGQQQLRITGSVLAPSGTPVNGATIKVKRAAMYAVTDEHGKFSVQVPSLKSTLVVSCIGFKETEIQITSDAPVRIVLEESNSKLNEVVVMGYGTMKKSDVSGAVSSINAKDISEKSYSNFQQFLSGRAPGVVVQESSGEPGAGLSIEIRGMSSISGSSQPLYVIDGIPFDASSATGSTYGPATITDPLAAINPNDIASLEILKDASATAIYGSRGANGVVLITTKKGKAGTPKVNFAYNQALAEMNFPIKRLNLADQVEAVNERRSYRYQDTAYLPDEIPDLHYYDHFKEVSRTGQIRDANVSVSGGSSTMKYYLSYQNFDQKGVYKASALNRNSLKANIQSELNQNLTIEGMLTYNRTVNTGFPVNPSFGGGLFASALAYSPLVPMVNPDGSYNKLGDYRYGAALYEDPVFGAIYYNPRFDLQTEILPAITDEPGNNTFVLIDQYKSANTTQQFVGNFNIGYKLGDHFVLNGKVGYISGQTLGETYRPRALPVEQTWKGMAYINNVQTKKLLYESTVNYHNTFGRHRVDGVIGATAETYEVKSVGAENREFPNDITGYYNIGAGSVLMPPSSDYGRNQLASFLGRFNYNYADKYLLTLTGRYDGSSRFAEGNRFGFFPSVGASWRVSREKFLVNSRVISDLRLRTSYGVIGNQAVGNYSTMSTITSGMNYGFGSVVNTAYASSRVPNPDLSWEESKQVNLGLDLSVFDSRINLSVDLYKKNVDKLLFNAQTPLTLGFPTMTQNVGAMENKGIEFQLSTINVDRAVKWRSDFNMGFNSNKLTRLNADVEFLQSGSEIGGLTRAYVGKPIGEIYGYRTLPVWNAESLATKPATFQPGVTEGDVRFADVNENGKLDDGDLVPLGNALPKFTGGFSNTISYKGFELNALISFSYGSYAYNALLAQMSDVGGNNTAYKYYDNRYRDIPAGTDEKTAAGIASNNATTHFPRAGSITDSRLARDYNVEETSYIRVNNITLGYNFQTKAIKGLKKIQNLRVFSTIENPWIFTSYSGINPEGKASDTSIGRGIDRGSYPLSRIISLGINFTY